MSATQYRLFFHLFALVVLTVAVIVAVVAVGNAMYSERACYQSWRQSGMQARYSFSGGCQIEVSRGVWIPDWAFTAYVSNQPPR